MSNDRTPDAESPGANRKQGRRPRAGWYDGSNRLDEVEWEATLKAMESEHGKADR